MASRLVKVGVAALAAATIGCAGAHGGRKESAAEAFGARSNEVSVAGASDAPKKPGSPEKWAKQFWRPQDCARAARELAQELGGETAWAYLKACVAKGDFTLLRTLLDEWAEPLRTKPESPKVVAHVIAARGGTVRSELRALQGKGLQIFDLASAMKQPKSFAGRSVLFVAKVDEIKVVKGRAEVTLLEMVSVSEAADASVGKHGGGRAVSGATSYVGRQADTVDVPVTHTFEPSGEVILVKLKEPDPYLAAERSFLFLARFEGSRVPDDTDDDDPHPHALISLISYYDIGALR